MFVEMVAQNQHPDASPAERKQADRDALIDALYRDHRRPLLRFCRRKLGKSGTEEDAAQIVQQAFCNLARHADPFEIKIPSAYLYRSVSNLVADRKRFLRRRANNRHLDISSISEDELISPAPSPERIAQARQDLTVIREVLEELPKKCRAIFALAKFDELSHEEISDRLGVSIHTVKKQLHKAKVQILARLREADERAAAVRRGLNGDRVDR